MHILKVSGFTSDVVDVWRSFRRGLLFLKLVWQGLLTGDGLAKLTVKLAAFTIHLLNTHHLIFTKAGHSENFHPNSGKSVYII